MERSYTFSDGSIFQVRHMTNGNYWYAEMYLKIDASSYMELSAYGTTRRQAVKRLHTEYRMVKDPGIRKIMDRLKPKSVFSIDRSLYNFVALFVLTSLLVGCASSPFSKEWVWKSTPGEYGGAEDSIRSANNKLNEARKRDPEMFKKLDKAVSDDVITVEVYDPEREKNENGKKKRK